MKTRGWSLISRSTVNKLLSTFANKKVVQNNLTLRHCGKSKQSNGKDCRHFSHCHQESVSRKVPKLFGPISGYIILFVSSERRCLEARNFAFILVFIPFTTYEKTGFPKLAGCSFTNGFSGPKGFPDFRETCPRPRIYFRRA